MRFLSVISLSSTRNALIWEEDGCPFKRFQNNFSSDSAALQSFVTLSFSRLFKEITHKQAIFFTKAAISVVNVTSTGKIMILPRPKGSLIYGTSSLDVIRKFNITYLLTGLFSVRWDRKISDKELSISKCNILSAAVLKSIRSHMSTSDRLLSTGFSLGRLHMGGGGGKCRGTKR